jgi:hypothetical protein
MLASYVGACVVFDVSNEIENGEIVAKSLLREIESVEQKLPDGQSIERVLIRTGFEPGMEVVPPLAAFVCSMKFPTNLTEYAVNCLYCLIRFNSPSVLRQCIKSHSPVLQSLLCRYNQFLAVE